ncbi:iron uptake porin [Phormidesmis sp. 146-33]
MLSLLAGEVHATEDSQASPTSQPSNTLETPSESLDDQELPARLQPLNPDAPFDLDEQTENPMGKLTSVTALSDVKPTDWAYQALKSLVERYGAIAGYPNITFRGNRSLTRYEFAAALSAAIPTVDLSSHATKKDLEDLQRMQAEFVKELEMMKGKVSRLERVIRPVSETTKLTGEVIIAPIMVGRAKQADDDEPTDSELTVSSRVRLNFLTNLGGKTRLRTRLQARNIPAIQRATGTDMARLGFQGDSENRFELSDLSLRSQLNKQVTLFASAVGGSLNDFTETLNPFLSGSGQGSISRFGQRNPIYRQGGGAGLGFSFELSKAVNLDVGYVVGNANNPAIGIDKASYSAIAQLTIEFSKTAALGLTYVRSFNSLDTNTGSDRANDPFDNKSAAITADSFGLETTIGLSKNLTLSGWVGFSHATARDLPGNPSANIFNWAVTLAVPNLGQERNLLGFVIGQPPKVTANDFQRKDEPYEDEDISLHLEMFYRIRLNKRISITPGLLIITRPEHNRENDPIFIGTLRTTFSF